MPKSMEEYDEEGEMEIQEEERRGVKRDRKRQGSNSRRRRKTESDEENGEDGGEKRFKSMFVDDEAIEDHSEPEDDEDNGELDGFIVDDEPELEDEANEIEGGGGGDRRRRTEFVPPDEDDEIDVEEFERRIADRFGPMHDEASEDDDDTEIGQQALIPSVHDPKLWLVKCAIGREREVAACLIQKCIVKPGELQITSAVALDHLRGFVYVEAYKEAHVREACKGLRYVMLQKITLVPIKEMTDVISGEFKNPVLYKWARIKTGIYKGDLAKVVGCIPGRQQVRVKVIPRFDLQALANGVESSKKGSGSRPDRVPALLRNMNLVRNQGVRVLSARDPLGHGYVEKIEGLHGMIFKDGFHLKVVSAKSVKEAEPSLEELEEFQELRSKKGNLDVDSIPNRKKGGGFVKGDAVVVTEGDLRNLVGHVDKIELGTVHIKAEMGGLPGSIAIKQTALQKCFKEGQHLQVVSGSQIGSTGMVVKVDQQRQLITILSDATKETICVFSDHAVESCEVNNGDTMADNPRREHQKTPARLPRFSGGGRCRDGQDGFSKGIRIKLRLGPYKGCKGRVVEVKGSSVRVELESQMRTVVIDCLHCVSDSDNGPAAVATPYRSGYETPMPYMQTPMRESPYHPMHPGYEVSPTRYMQTPLRMPLSSTASKLLDPDALHADSFERCRSNVNALPDVTPMRDPVAASSYTMSTPIHGRVRTAPLH